MRTILVLSAALLLVAAAARPAAAQISASSPAHQRAENRRALRDARQYPAEFKDSHLAVKPADLRRGAAGPPADPQDGRANYKFNRNGAARVSEPMYPGLRLRKKKNK